MRIRNLQCWIALVKIAYWCQCWSIYQCAWRPSQYGGDLFFMNGCLVKRRLDSHTICNVISSCPLVQTLRIGNSFAAHLLYLSNECLVKQSQHAKRGYEWLDYSRSGTTQRRLINSPDNENNPLELRRCLMFNKLSLFATHKCLFGQKTNAARKGVYSVP